VRIPDHPLVNETVSDCLHEAMDIDGLKAILRGINAGKIQTRAIETAEPSKFSHEILNANPFAFLDDAPLEERRARAVQLRSTLHTDVSNGIGALDPAAIAAVEEEVWPTARSADELHDALLTLVALPPSDAWIAFFEELVAARRACAAVVDGHAFWVPAEKLDVFRAAHRHTDADPAPDANDAVAQMLRGWLESTGPTTAETLAQRLALPRDAIEIALARLEMEGQVFHGSFRPGGQDEYCNRRVLARIHRRTIATLRREIEPVSTAQHGRFIDVWQHLAAGTQLHGLEGTLAVIRQLQGLEFPASSWEHEVLPKRVARYEPELLDKLCASGDVMWARLSPHPAFGDGAQPPGRRIRPSRIAPISLFLREDAGWLVTARSKTPQPLTAAAREVHEALQRDGASFFADLVRATARLASEVEDALWELVAAGLVTADGFDNLRALIDPKRRLALGRFNKSRPRNAAGRWALLRSGEKPHDVDRFANQLLARWGVVFRDVVRRETLAPAWRDLLVSLRRLELQGVVRGGRFVAGQIGEQFCRPDALEALRALDGDPDARFGT